MFTFPPIPSWDALHPLIIHFPIALLLVAPVLVLLGILLSKQSRGLLIAALVVMALGTIATYFAVATGEAAGELAERMPGVAAVLERHEDLAQIARAIFTALTIGFGAILFVPAILKKGLGRKSTAVVNLAFLVLYAGGAIVLANVAHQGGRLVHEYGVHAMMTTGGGSAPAQGTESKEDRQKDSDREKEK
jgi:uncharacterized membrane protein